MIPWKEKLTWRWIFLLRGLSTRTISPLFTVGQPVSSSTFDSSNKTVICEVLLGVRYKYLIFRKVNRAKTLHSLTAYLSWIQVARHFEFNPRTLTVTEKWASIFPGKTSLYSAPSCLTVWRRCCYIVFKTTTDELLSC